MNGTHSRNDRGPWVEVAGYPLRTPTVLVLVCLGTMLLTTLSIAFNGAPGAKLGSWLWFDSELIWTQAQLWRLGTYVLWNRPDPLGFSMDLLMLWWFGRELEDFFGRRFFLRLCAGLVVVPAVVGALVGWFSPFKCAGIDGVFSLFVAFATLAPEVTLLFGVSAKWMAVLFLGLKGLAALASHAWGPLGMTLAGAAFAFGYVRYEQGLWEWPTLGSLFSGIANGIATRIASGVRGMTGVFTGGKEAKTLPFEIVREEESPGTARGEGFLGAEPSDSEVLACIDPLLEKIGRSGMASLTEQERAQLQQARERLLRRESRKTQV